MFNMPRKPRNSATWCNGKNKTPPRDASYYPVGEKVMGCPPFNEDYVVAPPSWRRYKVPNSQLGKYVRAPKKKPAGKKAAPKKKGAAKKKGSPKKKGQKD